MGSEVKPFDFINDISGKKKYLMTDANEKDYVAFLAARYCSMYPDTLQYAAEINLYRVDNRLHHDYLFHGVRKTQRKFIKWPKKPSNEDVEAVMKIYNLSESKAVETLACMKPEDIEKIKRLADGS